MGWPLRSWEDRPRQGRRRPDRNLRQLRLGEAPPANAVPATRPPLTALPAAAPRPGLEPMDLVQAATGALPGLAAFPVPAAGLPEALLAEGDVVLVQGDAPLVAGELFAIRLAGSDRLLLRRLHPEGDFLRLQPEDRAYPARVAAQHDVVVEGRVVAIMRQAAQALPKARGGQGR